MHATIAELGPKTEQMQANLHITAMQWIARHMGRPGKIDHKADRHC